MLPEFLPSKLDFHRKRSEGVQHPMNITAARMLRASAWCGILTDRWSKSAFVIMFVVPGTISTNSSVSHSSSIGFFSRFCSNTAAAGSTSVIVPVRSSVNRTACHMSGVVRPTIKKNPLLIYCLYLVLLILL